MSEVIKPGDDLKSIPLDVLERFDEEHLGEFENDVWVDIAYYLIMRKKLGEDGIKKAIVGQLIELNNQ